MNRLIDTLPRNTAVAPNAIVWQDASGRICVELVGGGALILDNSGTPEDWLWDLEEVR